MHKETLIQNDPISHINGAVQQHYLTLKTIEPREKVEHKYSGWPPGEEAHTPG